MWLVVELGLLVVQGGLSPPCHVPGCSLGRMFHIIHGVMSHSIPWDPWGGRCEAVSGGMSHPPSPSLGSTRVSPTVKPKPLTCCSWPWSGSWDFQTVYRGNSSCKQFAQPGGDSAGVARLWPVATTVAAATPPQQSWGCHWSSHSQNKVRPWSSTRVVLRSAGHLQEANQMMQVLKIT